MVLFLGPSFYPVPSRGCPQETQNLLLFLQTKKDHPYTWRIELAKTEKYWDGWFRGLSNLFLSCPIPKLLLLAGECICVVEVGWVSEFGDSNNAID